MVHRRLGTFDLNFKCPTVEPGQRIAFPDQLPHLQIHLLQLAGSFEGKRCYLGRLQYAGIAADGGLLLILDKHRFQPANNRLLLVAG